MSFEDFKVFYVLSLLGLGSIILAPTLALTVRLPSGERFSELWILGSGHMAEDYPFNVRLNETCKIYLGIGNHMNGLQYYRVLVKFRNGTESSPDALNATPSTLDPLVEYRLFLSNDDVWEKEILFSVQDFVFEGNSCRVSRITINWDIVNLSPIKIATWNEESKGFYFQLFFELWLHKAEFVYHNRFVGIWLNMTKSV